MTGEPAYPREAMRILIVYNPQAAHARARTLLPDVTAAFSTAGVETDVRLTEELGHATRIAAATPFADYDGIVAAGGDGTLFEVINGYYENTSSRRIPLGVLPVGTGNAFARDIGLKSGGWSEAVGMIAGGKTRRADVGRFTTQGKRMHYLNILGLGFVADVVDSASRLKLFGNMSYTLGVLFRTISLKAYRIRIDADGKVIEADAIFTEISNTRFTSNFLMAPAARIDDGLLDLTLLKKINRRRLLQCFPLIFSGEHVKMPEVETLTAQRIRITTDVPKVLTPDGELLGATPVDIECLPRDIEVFCG
jgi:diacylglycerol kinase (ATP)